MPKPRHIAAITSPFSFQIIGPYPEQFWSAKIAASKFILKTECGGGCHFFLTDAGVKIESCNSCWCLKSLRKSISLLFSQLGSLKLLPYSTAFLWFHINHAWTRNTSGSDLDSLSTRYSNRSIISQWLFVNFWSRGMHLPSLLERRHTPTEHALRFQVLSHNRGISRQVLFSFLPSSHGTAIFPDMLTSRRP